MNGDFQRDVALLLLRLSGFGIAFSHGLGKIVLLANGEGERFVDQIANLGFPQPGLFSWAAALAEFVGGILIALGVWTRIAAAFSAVTMFVAAVVRKHLIDHVLAFLFLSSTPPETLDKIGSPEMAFLYLLIFLALVLQGGGRYSLPRLFKKRRTFRS